MIEFSKNRLFHLYSRNTSYLMRVTETGALEHLYAGSRLKDPEKSLRAISPKHFAATGMSILQTKEKPGFSLGDMNAECTYEGAGDYRTPLIAFREEGTLDLRYRAHRAYPGIRRYRDELPQATGTDRDAETLEIMLRDERKNIEVTLIYTLWRELDVITRRTLISNKGSKDLTLTAANSLQLDLDEKDMELTYLTGAWGRESTITAKRMREGKELIESRRWNSSTDSSPSFALENGYGECWMFSFIWSSAFRNVIEQDPYGRTHIIIGINPGIMELPLRAGDDVETPEAVMTFSTDGKKGASRNLRHFTEDTIYRDVSRARMRPIMLSTSELGLDIDQDRVRALSKKASELGLEGIIIDDGWFGARKNKNVSLGDWYVNPMKFSDGMKEMGRCIHDDGLLFGLSINLEVMNRISNLYVEHPDWALHDRKKTEWSGRSDDFLLDLTDRKVQDWLVQTVSSMIDTFRLDALRIEGTRPQSEVPAKGDTAYEWMKGLYKVLNRIQRKYPELFLFSGMAGGSRFDLAMMQYASSILLTENTDPLTRLESLEGSSLFYPAAMRTMRVTGTPDRMMGKFTDLESRFDMSCFGNIEYSMDLTQLTKDEELSVRQQTEFYKQYRDILQRGDLEVLEKDETKTVMALSDSRKDTFLVLYAVKSLRANDPYDRIRLRDADPEKTYVVTSRDRVQTEIKDSISPQELECYEIGGDALRGAGIVLGEKDTGTGRADDMRKLSDRTTRLYIIRTKEGKK